jgi:hypothetical protein
MATYLLSCYGLLMWIHSYFVSFGMVMDISAGMVETRSAGFLVEPQNQGRRFVSGLASKPLGRFLVIWPQNLLRLLSLVWPQNQWRRFSPVWPQNWWRRFLPVWPQNRRSVSC